MKIAVTGAHRVGKTTLAERLHEFIPDYEYYPEPYYELEERGYVFSEIPAIDDYLVQLEYSIRQMTASGNHAIFDRCPIDLLAYIQATDESGSFQSLYHKVQNVMTEIDLLVFVPIEKPDVIQCPDSALPELREQVNDILRELISDSDIETIEVNGTISERLEQVKHKIREGL